MFRINSIPPSVWTGLSLIDAAQVAPPEEREEREGGMGKYPPSRFRSESEGKGERCCYTHPSLTYYIPTLTCALNDGPQLVMREEPRPRLSPTTGASSRSRSSGVPAPPLPARPVPARPGPDHQPALTRSLPTPPRHGQPASGRETACPRRHRGRPRGAGRAGPRGRRKARGGRQGSKWNQAGELRGGQGRRGNERRAGQGTQNPKKRKGRKQGRAKGSPSPPHLWPRGVVIENRGFWQVFFLAAARSRSQQPS